jgi:hypothetical protein
MLPLGSKEQTNGVRRWLPPPDSGPWVIKRMAGRSLWREAPIFPRPAPRVQRDYRPDIAQRPDLPLTHAPDSFGEEVRGALTHLPISLAEGQRVKVSYRKRRNHPTNACQVAISAELPDSSPYEVGAHEEGCRMQRDFRCLQRREAPSIGSPVSSLLLSLLDPSYSSPEEGE